MSMAMAKPMFWASPLVAVLMPTTWPAELTSGPPELPGLMAASVWIRPLRLSSVASIERFRAETMPSVTVIPPCRLRALPMAITLSPTFRAEELPRSATGRLLTPLILTRARSLLVSAPITVALWDWVSVPTVTLIDVAPATTWALVSSSPSGVSTMPVPAPLDGKKRPDWKAWVRT